MSECWEGEVVACGADSMHAGVPIARVAYEERRAGEDGEERACSGDAVMGELAWELGVAAGAGSPMGDGDAAMVDAVAESGRGGACSGDAVAASNSGGLAGTAAEAVDDGYKTTGSGGAGESTRRSRRGKNKQSGGARQNQQRRGHDGGE